MIKERKDILIEQAETIQRQMEEQIRLFIHYAQQNVDHGSPAQKAKAAAFLTDTIRQEKKRTAIMAEVVAQEAGLFQLEEEASN